MKKQLLLIALFAVSVCYSYSQAPTGFGVKGGITSSNLKFTNIGGSFDVSSDSKIGFYGGVFAQVGISEKFAIQPEVLYALYSSKLTVQSFGDADQNLSYVTIPLLAKYIQEGLSVFVGPQVGFVVSAKSKSGGSTDDIKDRFKSTDFSGVIGAGYTTLSGFGFDARYQIGLSDIASDDFSGTLGGGKVKNNALMFGVHYLFQR
ncbi:MAG: porin family protein [Ginsengibacter sp.]